MNKFDFKNRTAVITGGGKETENSKSEPDAENESESESENNTNENVVSEKATKKIMELVGSAPLKDLVADTSDIVEKICIETALKMTKNNRVATAEMLNLSRQSLYVKLRKYNLL